MKHSENPSSSQDMKPVDCLIPQARAGDQQAQEEICRQVRDYLQMMAAQHLDPSLKRKLNPSDIVQQTMIRMVNGLENFRGTSTQEFYGWLTTILKNEIHTIRRDLHREKRDIKRETELADDSQQDIDPLVTDPELTPCSQAIRTERMLRLETMMKTLPQEMADVIRMRTLDGLSFQEIAQTVGKSYDTTYKLWKRAVIRFQAELDRESDSVF